MMLAPPVTEDLRRKKLQKERIIKAPAPAYKPLKGTAAYDAFREKP